MIKLITQMIVNLLLTIVIELSLGLIIGVRKKSDIYDIIFINCVTNLVLNYIINICSFFLYKNVMILYILVLILEILVVIIEYKFYKKNLNFKKINLLIFSIILNVSSFLIGLVLLKVN